MIEYRKDAVAALSVANVAALSHRSNDGMIRPFGGLSKTEWRRYVGFVLRLEAVLAGFSDREQRITFTRAGCECICTQCGLRYAEHPDDVEPESGDDIRSSALTVLCDRSRVKL